MWEGRLQVFRVHQKRLREKRGKKLHPCYNFLPLHDAKTSSWWFFLKKLLEIVCTNKKNRNFSEVPLFTFYARLNPLNNPVWMTNTASTWAFCAEFNCFCNNHSSAVKSTEQKWRRLEQVKFLLLTSRGAREDEKAENINWRVLIFSVEFILFWRHKSRTWQSSNFTSQWKIFNSGYRA